MRPCLTKDICSLRLMKVHPFTDLKKNTKSLISLSYVKDKIFHQVLLARIHRVARRWTHPSIAFK